MFEEYRNLLKIICSKEWNADENHKEINNFLDNLGSVLAVEPKLSVLLNLLPKLLQKAFNENDRELLYLVINVIIGLDEILEKDRERTREKIKDKSELPVEKEKVSEEQIEEEKDETLSRDYGTSIKKNAVKEVLSKIKKDFSLNDLEEIITDYYRKVLKSKVTDRGLQVYASSYKRFLIDFGLCRRDSIPERPPPKKSAVVYHLTGKEIGTIQILQKLEKSDGGQKKVNRSSLSNKARYIILWSEKNATDVIDVDAVYLHKMHPIGENYRIKDIYDGLDELVERGMATRFSKKRYTIKREMIIKE